MKKAVLLISLCLLSKLAHSQELLRDSFTVTQDRVFLEASHSQAAFGSGMEPQAFQARLGVKLVPRLYLLGHAGFSLGREQRMDFSTRKVGGFDYGVGLDYRLLQNFKKEWVLFRTLDVHALWATTNSKSDWEYRRYELGFTLGMRGRYTPTIGIGYQYYDSRTTGLPNYRGLFATIGIRL